MCPAPVQRSDVQKTNACTSEYAHKTSSVDLNYDADPSSITTASSDSTHKPCDRCELEQSAENRCAKHRCKLMLVTLAAYGGRQHGQKTSLVDDEYTAHPRSSITASSGDTDLVTDVHWNHSSICAQFQYSAQLCMKPMQAHLRA